METLLSECVADQELGEEIEKRSKHFLLPSDCTLFLQGDEPSKLYFLKAGAAELTLTAEDQTVMNFHARPGSLIGLPAVLTKQPYSLTARVYAGAEICELSPQDFREMVAANGRFAMQVLRILASEVRSIFQVLSRDDHPERIA